MTKDYFLILKITQNLFGANANVKEVIEELHKERIAMIAVFFFVKMRSRDWPVL
jgi:hypothetical protein